MSHREAPTDPAPVTPLVEEPNCARMTLRDGSHDVNMGAKLLVTRGKPVDVTARAGSFYYAVCEAERRCGMWFSNMQRPNLPRTGPEAHAQQQEALKLFFMPDMIEQPTHRVTCRTVNGTPILFVVKLRADGRAVVKLDAFDDDPDPLFIRTAPGVWVPQHGHEKANKGMAVVRVEALAEFVRPRAPSAINFGGALGGEAAKAGGKKRAAK